MCTKYEIAQGRLKLLVEAVIPALEKQIRDGDGIRQTMSAGLFSLIQEKEALERFLREEEEIAA